MINTMIINLQTKSVMGNDLSYDVNRVKKFRMTSNSNGGKFDKSWHDICTYKQTLGLNNNNRAFHRRIVEDIIARKIV